MVSDKAVEAAARAICRRRIEVAQERSGLPILTEAHLQETVDTTWRDYADDARVALDAAMRVRRRGPDAQGRSERPA